MAVEDPKYKELIEKTRSALEPILAQYPELLAFVVVPCWASKDGTPPVARPDRPGFLSRLAQVKMDPAAFIHAAVQTNMMETLLLQSIEQHLVASKRKYDESTKEAPRPAG